MKFKKLCHNLEVADYHREANRDSQLILKINKYYIKEGERNKITLQRTLERTQNARGRI